MDEILLLVICILLFGLMIAIKELIFWVQSIYEREKLIEEKLDAIDTSIRSVGVDATSYGKQA